jgi:hypothetical protein
MHNTRATMIRLATACCVLGTLVNATAATPSPEDRYIAARDAAIEKISKLYDAGKGDDATQAEKSASADLLTQMKAIVAESGRNGFGPAKLNIETFSRGDMGFGTLDGLRFDALTDGNGDKANENGADGKYVQPRAHIIVTTQAMFERWLREHKDWWGKNIKNLPQAMGAALKDESFYTQAIQTDAAIVNFNSLPVTNPGLATFSYAMLAGRTQDDVPNEADEVFVSALANGKVYVAYGSIKPKVLVPACHDVRTDYNKKADKATNDLQSHRIDQKAYDKLGDLRQQGADAFKRCFAQRASQLPAFAEATKQAQALLAEAMGK